MADETVLYEERDSLGIITLNRPEKLNTLNESVIAGMADAVDRATASEQVRSIILRGAGRAFTGGYDLTPGKAGPRFTSLYGAPAWMHARAPGILCATTSSWGATRSAS